MFDWLDELYFYPALFTFMLSLAFIMFGVWGVIPVTLFILAFLGYANHLLGSNYPIDTERYFKGA